jgi:hypothetical protein
MKADSSLGVITTDDLVIFKQKEQKERTNLREVGKELF